MLFKFKAQTPTGEVVEGEAEATDKFSLAAELKKKRYTVLVARELRSGRSRLKTYIEGILGVVHLHEKIIFMRSLSAMLKAGLSLTHSLSILGRQSKSRGRFG